MLERKPDLPTPPAVLCTPDRIGIRIWASLPPFTPLIR